MNFKSLSSDKRAGPPLSRLSRRPQAGARKKFTLADIHPARIFSLTPGQQDETDFVRRQLRGLLTAVSENEARRRKYLAFCQNDSLRPDCAALALCEQLSRTIEDGAEAAINSLRTEKLRSLRDWQQELTGARKTFRALSHLLFPLNSALDWRSPAYRQTVDPQFYGLETQNPETVNYGRYQSSCASRIEAQLKEALGLSELPFDLLVTSSGMAAYNVVESFLLRHVIESGDTVLIPYYIYFEVEEQISSLRHINLIRQDTYDSAEILELVSRHNPRVLFLDPMTNTAEQRVVDVSAVLSGIAQMDLRRDIFVVMDGTMLSGATREFFTAAEANPRVKLLYTESCSKYLQLGLDFAMAGLVCVPSEFRDAAERQRRNTGAILYDNAGTLFPRFSSSELNYRMRRLTENALLIAEELQSDLIVNEGVETVFPLLTDHPDFEIARQLRHTGGLLTFQFRNSSLNSRESLNRLIDQTLAQCRLAQIPLAKGVSFGFSMPRISAAASMAATCRPFLRLSVGDQDRTATRKLAVALRTALREYIEMSQLQR